MFANFDQVFVPVFVAMSTLTIVPIFLAMTEGMQLAAARSMARKAIGTALAVAIGITLAGQAVFRLLGITVDDLRVGGGIILLIISLHDLLFSSSQRKQDDMGGDTGVVPLGVPLIVGPATMTTCLVLADAHGRMPVLAALVANLAITAVLLDNAHRMRAIVRPAVVRAFGKVMSLFMTAIAVSMIRTGLANLIRQMVG